MSAFPERLADLPKAPQLAGGRTEAESLTLSHSRSCVPNTRTTSPVHLPFQTSCQWVVSFCSLVISGPSCHLPCALGRVTSAAQHSYWPLLHSDPSPGSMEKSCSPHCSPLGRGLGRSGSLSPKNRVLGREEFHPLCPGSVG